MGSSLVYFFSSKRARLFLLIVTVVVVLGGRFLYFRITPKNFTATGDLITLQLSGGPFQCPYFPTTERPKGLVVLGTGDGGWSYWEDNTANSLASHGYAVVGWDCRKFADSRKFTQDQLVIGFNSAVNAGLSLSKVRSLPVWFGGWSTGAEQSVAAAASRKRNRNLVGLLLAAPGTRGRFGINTSDLLGIVPTGEDTFAMSEMGAKLAPGIKVAQFAAGIDPLDDVDWLESCAVEHKLYELPTSLHDMGGAGQEFQTLLLEAIDWTLKK